MSESTQWEIQINCLEVCEDYTDPIDCHQAGCYWYNGSCHTDSPTCEIFNNQTDCEAYDCYWCNGACQSTPCGVCSDYTTQAECIAADCYWYNNSCHSTPQTEIPWMMIGAGIACAAVGGIIILLKWRK